MADRTKRRIRIEGICVDEARDERGDYVIVESAARPEWLLAQALTEGEIELVVAGLDEIAANRINAPDVDELQDRLGAALALKADA